MTNSTKKKKAVTNPAGAKGKPLSLHPLSTQEALRVLLKAKPLKKENAQKIAPKPVKKSQVK